MGDMREKVARAIWKAMSVVENVASGWDEKPLEAKRETLAWRQACAALEACHFEALVEALKQIAELQNDKCQTAPAELLYVLLDIKVGMARAALAKVEASDE